MTKKKSKKKKGKEKTIPKVISPKRAAQLLVDAYGEEMGIDEAYGHNTFTNGQLDRLKRMTAADTTLSQAVKVLQGQKRLQKGTLDTAFGTLGLRRPRR